MIHDSFPPPFFGGGGGRIIVRFGILSVAFVAKFIPIFNPIQYSPYVLNMNGLLQGKPATTFTITENLSLIKVI